MGNCLFCRIVQGEIPAEIVYEDEQILAFKDINPKAAVHVLVVPKQHIDSLADATTKDQDILGYISVTIPKIAQKLDLHDGFRTIVNTGKGGGQEVFHIHYHVLGGGGPLPFA